MPAFPLFERLKDHKLPVVVDFWAPWCGPCRTIEPALKQLGKEYEGRVDVWRINADENTQLLQELNIYGIPTLVAFHGGREVSRRTGAASAAGLRPLFESALQNTKADGHGLSLVDRLLRLALGTALLFFAYQVSQPLLTLLLGALGGLALFSAVHDRCPIWQAVSPKLKAILNRLTQRQDSSGS